MSAGLLIDCDEQVAAYLFKNCVSPVMKFDRAIGLIVDGSLAGGILFQCFNGFNVELSYYGRKTMTSGIIRCLARFLISTFNPSRVTVTVNRRQKRLMRSLRKLGFVLEGTQRCFYGHQDKIRNTGVRFVLFRESLNKLAALDQEATHAAAASQ